MGVYPLWRNRQAPLSGLNQHPCLAKLLKGCLPDESLELLADYFPQGIIQALFQQVLAWPDKAKVKTEIVIGQHIATQASIYQHTKIYVIHLTLLIVCRTGQL